MSSKPRVPSVHGQVVTCVLFCLVAAVIILVAHAPPKGTALSVGLPLWRQTAVSLAVAGVIAAFTSIAIAVPRFRRLIALPAGALSVDVSGHKPLQIAFAAGIGEELLFRAALQPLVGLWWAAGIFAIAHVRTATLAGSHGKRAIYIANVWIAGLALGIVYQYVGLLAVVVIHASIDLAALLSLKWLKSAGAPRMANDNLRHEGEENLS